MVVVMVHVVVVVNVAVVVNVVVVVVVVNVVVVAVEEAEVVVQVVAVTTPRLLLEGVEEEGEETVLSTKQRCSNNWKRFCSNNNKRPQVAALLVSRPPTRSRPPIKTDNVLP